MQPPCVPPNIDNYVTLDLIFQNAEVGDSVPIIRLNKNDQSVFDTINVVLPEGKLVRIGGGSEIGFSDPGQFYDQEQVAFDFIIEPTKGQLYRVTDIEIKRTLPECGCAEYEISTLKLDEELIEVNSDYYILRF